jgi:hypothetical protein
MNTIVSNGRGSGAVLFQTFPQEVVDVFAEQTGGKNAPVRLPKMVNGYVRFDDQQRVDLPLPVQREADTDLRKHGRSSIKSAPNLLR